MPFVIPFRPGLHHRQEGNKICVLPDTDNEKRNRRCSIHRKAEMIVLEIKMTPMYTINAKEAADDAFCAITMD
jgi:hypothetical protein